MTLTFNSQEYRQLLMQYQPKVIETEAENEKALAIVEELMHRHPRSPAENALYELLILLIEKFEEKFYHPGVASTPHSMLLFLMEQQAIAPQDLVQVLGTEEEVTAILEQCKVLDQEQSKKLAVFFNVDHNVFS